MVSIVFIFRIVEHYILNRKPIFIILAILSLCVDLFALILIIINFVWWVVNPSTFNIPFYLFQINVQNLEPIVREITLPILGLAICVLYYLIAHRSAGDVKKQALEMFFGVILFCVGIILNLGLLANIDWFQPYQAILMPAFLIAGISIIFLSIK